MKRTLTAAVLLSGALLVGCSGPTNTVEDPEDQGLIETDAIGWNELRPAVDDMLKKISEINAEGWPSHVVMTPETPKKAVLRIHNIQNRTRERLDIQAYKNELMNALVNQGIVYVVGDSRDRAAVGAERDYSDAGNTTQELTGDEDATGLVLQGEIQDFVIDQENARQHDYQFNLRLIDTKKNRVLKVTSTKFRKKKSY
ncbi:MAG TPA: hypothetical protein DEA08_03360 [Planctomycetes bacterium]|mgnify:CR=1 FL=1|nr:hypothetical protein [Planctomycetota bacterium]|tara:strand:- start:690 stop:1286 length:597 start_codon:yes stop_codon:yes gene_type:complete